MRVLFTGASSFTGLWFVKALSANGHAVTVTLTKPLDTYTGIRRHRLDQLQPIATLADETTFGTPTFLQLLSQGHFELLCHHAADVTNYNSADFNAITALASNTHGLHGVLARFKECGGRAVILTGSVFEADEGRGEDDNRPAFNPYGLSKTLTAQTFRFYAASQGLTLGKFVIPNPFGPWEEPRFTAHLMKMWKQFRTAEVKTPDYVRDNVPVDLLAACYERFACDVAGMSGGFARLNPSCYSETQGDFAHRFAREMKLRLNLECALAIGRQVDFSQPMVRVNTDCATALIPEWSEEAFWDDVAAYYQRNN